MWKDISKLKNVNCIDASELEVTDEFLINKLPKNLKKLNLSGILVKGHFIKHLSENIE